MAVLFATLGFTPQLALAPLRTRPNYEALHVFYGPRHPEGVAALKAVKSACQTLGLPVVAHKVVDPFDYTAFLQAFNQAVRQLPGKSIEVNASGGSRVGIMAATIFCFSRNIPLLYFDEYGTKDGKEIPLRAFRGMDGLGETPQTIVRRLKGDGPADMGTLAAELGLARSTLTEHVQTLVKASVVEVARSGKRRIVRLVPDLAAADMEVANLE